MNTETESARAFMALDGLLAVIQERSEAFERHLDAQPQTRQCHVPGHGLASLNREASRLAAKAAYTCAACEHQAFLARGLGRIEAAGIPADVRHATLDNFRVDRPGVNRAEGYSTPASFLEKVRSYAEGTPRNMFLTGTPGIGKGHLAAAIAIRTLFAGQTVRWTECARLFSEYHRAYDQKNTEQVIDAHSRVALLVLDEICLRELPADGEEILFAILDRRHKAGRRTILIGNKSAEETRKWLGSRIIDRLRSGGCRFCYGEWTSMRGGPADGAQEEL